MFPAAEHHAETDDEIEATRLMTRVLRLVAALLSLAPAACQTDSRQQILVATHTPIALPTAQTRAFDTTDTNRTVIVTLQDLGFVIDKAGGRLVAVSAQ